MSDATADPRPDTPSLDPQPTGGPEDGVQREDHAAIEQLATELVPALAAKLAASGLGEIELREGGWRLRLRRPAGSGTSGGHGRRWTDRPSRAQPGHEGHGHAPGALEGHRNARSSSLAAHSTNGTSSAEAGASERSGDGAAGRDPHRVIASSPAVGVFTPRAETSVGTRVRSGDRVGAVNMLGVPQEVVAPADGIVAQILVEAGDAVEYGQELVAIEPMTQATHGGGGRP